MNTRKREKPVALTHREILGLAIERMREKYAEAERFADYYEKEGEGGIASEYRRLPWKEKLEAACKLWELETGEVSEFLPD